MIPYMKAQLLGIFAVGKAVFSKSSGYLIKIAAMLWVFLAGIHLYILTVFALTIFDCITGITASLKRGEKFSSREFRKGWLEKMCLYGVLLLSVFCMDKIMKSVIDLEKFYLSSVITFMICSYELSSVAENLNTIHPIPFLQGLSRIFNKMNAKAVGDLEQKVDTIADAATDLKIKSADKPSSDVKH